MILSSFVASNGCLNAPQKVFTYPLYFSKVKPMDMNRSRFALEHPVPTYQARVPKAFTIDLLFSKVWKTELSIKIPSSQT